MQKKFAAESSRAPERASTNSKRRKFKRDGQDAQEKAMKHSSK
jgi:hypothetical protein